MGQAQLLLIVLGVVLVGIAIIAGIQAYDQNNRKASVDALTHDAMRIASDLQTWAQKPVQLGGPETPGDFTKAVTGVTDGNATTGNVTLEILGYTVDSGDGTTAGSGRFVNANGECALAVTAALAASIECGNENIGTAVVVAISGLSDNDILVSSRELEDGPTWASAEG